MRHLFTMLAAGAALAAPAARAEDPGQAIRTVISDQIAAFRTQDYARAFGYASPNIQAAFGSPTRFGEMVAHGYSSVLDPAETRFLGHHAEGGHEVQRLMVRGADGRVVLWDYHMVEVDGRWRIDAVTPVQAQGVGV
ncbi:DUF4864 domain-containing protein [Acidimangrovimonas sediminis]|uniref:DUF4864 domain-containing protein n=1 Tax=Acidimangrovimonas sediminis TaxID=2056283 RepID=UPI000C7F8DE6|nr:DUF4864 domain-containing protein [Acidimangrovimonas sediminis]